MPSRRRSPPATRRRALELLTASPDGCSEAIMVAHGFSVTQMVDLVHDGTARDCRQRTIEVARVKITEAGRQALTDKPKR
jgi:hypothetical protein